MGICATSEKVEGKTAVEMCCKDGKPGAGKPSPDLCKEKDEAKLKEALKKAATDAAKKPATTETPAKAATAPVTGGDAGKKETTPAASVALEVSEAVGNLRGQG